MKIAISSAGNDLSAQVDQRFGRAKGFIIYNEADGSFEYIDNSISLNATQGAGIQASKTIINSEAEILITGNVGQKAFKALSESRIQIYTGVRGAIKDVIELLISNKLKKAEEATVISNH
jgi:predicted Fe-Mo cluster-binding NifX family protein